LDLPTIPGPSHNGGVLKIGPDKKSVYLVIGNLNYVQNQTFITKAQNNKNGPPLMAEVAFLELPLMAELLVIRGCLETRIL
jgi:hypothetical protein